MKTFHAARWIILILPGLATINVSAASERLLYAPIDHQHLQSAEAAKAWVAENAEVISRALKKYRSGADEELLFQQASSEWHEPSQAIMYKPAIPQDQPAKGRFVVLIPIVQRGSQWTVRAGRVVVGFQRLARTKYDEETERSTERLGGKRIVRTTSKRSVTERETPVAVTEPVRPGDRPLFAPMVQLEVDRRGRIYYMGTSAL